MSLHHHDRVVQQIFSHPVSMSIRWSEVRHLVARLGGTTETAHGGGREKIRLNGQERTFHVPHSGTIESKDEVVALRHFLVAAGVQPADASTAGPGA